jgi:hypothetical protein
MLRPGVPFRPILPTVWARTGCVKDVRSDPSVFRLLVSLVPDCEKGEKKRDVLPGTWSHPNPPAWTGAVANSFQTRTIAPASPLNASLIEAL